MPKISHKETLRLYNVVMNEQEIALIAKALACLAKSEAEVINDIQREEAKLLLAAFDQI